MRWKLSCDATPAPGLETAFANANTVAALILVSLLEQDHQQKQQQQQQQQQQQTSTSHDIDPTNNDLLAPDVNLSLQDETTKLQGALVGYRHSVTNDPLGWGLDLLYDQFLVGHPFRPTLVQLQDCALDGTTHLRQGSGVPYRLYGAMIGARTTGVATSLVEDLLEECLDYETTAAAIRNQCGSNQPEHDPWCINRVMLAMCLLSPGVLKWRKSDPLVEL